MATKNKQSGETEKPGKKLSQIWQDTSFSTGSANIEFQGNRYVIVEGCRGVIEYDENIIRLNIPKGSVRFMGRNLQITSLTQNQAMIEGFVQSMEFIM